MKKEDINRMKGQVEDEFVQEANPENTVNLENKGKKKLVIAGAVAVMAALAIVGTGLGISSHLKNNKIDDTKVVEDNSKKNSGVETAENGEKTIQPSEEPTQELVTENTDEETTTKPEEDQKIYEIKSDDYDEFEDVVKECEYHYDSMDDNPVGLEYEYSAAPGFDEEADTVNSSSYYTSKEKDLPSDATQEFVSVKKNKDGEVISYKCALGNFDTAWNYNEEDPWRIFYDDYTGLGGFVINYNTTMKVENSRYVLYKGVKLFVEYYNPEDDGYGICEHAIFTYNNNSYYVVSYEGLEFLKNLIDYLIENNPSIPDNPDENQAYN